MPKAGDSKMNKLKRDIAIAALALVASVWAVWFQSGGFEYIRLDDNIFVFDFSAVAGGLSIEGIRGVFSNFTQGGIWMPMTSITYMADISLFGATPGVHHLSSVGWHTANTLLLFALLLRLARRWMREGEPLPVFACVLAALFWAVHPLRNESVAWIASRKDLVFSFFTFLGLHAWLRRDMTGRLLGWICCALACLSKPTAMVFPFIALILDLIAADEDETLPARLRHVRWWSYAPLLLMAFATGCVAIYSQTHSTGVDADVRGLYEGYGSLPWRCLNAAVAVGLYIAQTVVPVGVHVMYRSIVGGAPQGLWIGLAVLAASGCALFLCVRGRKGGAALLPLLAVGWFIVAIGPTLGVAGGFGNQARADRFLYLPAVGFSILIAWGLAKMHLRRAWLVVCALLAAGYGYAAWRNAKTYATDYTLFSRVLEWDDRHDLALAHVGSELCARYGMPDEGIECFRRAMAANPKAEDTAAQLVFALATRGRREDHGEIRQYCSKLLAEPELDEKGLATEALGMITMKEMKWDDAIRFFNASIHAPKRTQPPDTAMIRLGMCYHNKGDLDRAERAFAYLAHSATDPKVKARSQQALQDIWKRKGTNKQ